MSEERLRELKLKKRNIRERKNMKLKVIIRQYKKIVSDELRITRALSASKRSKKKTII